MHLLVSFCNVTQPGRPALGLLALPTLTFRSVRLPPSLPEPLGITGLALTPEYLLAVRQIPQDPGELLIFDRTDLSLRSRPPSGRCAIYRLCPDRFTIEATVDLSATGSEIYDLLPVEGAEHWPGASETSLLPTRVSLPQDASPRPAAQPSPCLQHRAWHR